jgi:hypothetical protein
MNRYRTFIFSLIAGCSFLLMSCHSDDVEKELTLTPDVIHLIKERNETVEHALAYYVYTNQELTSVKAITPEGDTLLLTSMNSPLITYGYLPGDDDFSPGIPTSGLYTFIARNKQGTEKTEQDRLADTWLTIPEITDITYHPDDFSLDISWTPSPGTDNYFVRILTPEEQETLYIGYQVSPDSTRYTVTLGDQGWEKTPIAGEAYLLQLNAILYEEDIPLNAFYYHVNAIAMDEQGFTWGQ